MTKITIAIDGFSSTGKSTVAKQLAKALGYVYVDSGAMYRAVTFYAMENGLIGKDYFNREALVSQLSSLQISFKFNKEKGFAEVYLNNENIEHYIRTLDVSKYVSLIAEVSEVRQQLVEQQKKFGKHKGVVMDGRDIGTVVFPDAELKLFMTASAEKRAKRRYDELLQRGEEVSYDAVLKNVQTRDFIDSNREDSPLTMAEGAVKVDNSNMTLEEQFDFVFNQSEQKINEVHKKKQH